MRNISYQISGPWELTLTHEGLTQKIRIPPAIPVHICNEQISSLPVFQQDKAWKAGIHLKHLDAYETGLLKALDPDSLHITDSAGTEFAKGKDWQMDADWGLVGRTAGCSAIAENMTVFASYDYYPRRLDSIVLSADNIMRFLPGKINGAAPILPELQENEIRLCNIYFSEREKTLSDSMIYPVFDEHIQPEFNPDAEKRLCKTLAKLRNGKKVKILAWGDSVTEGIYLPPEERWPKRFTDFLKQQYPSAQIELQVAGWGGKNTLNFMNEPAGSIHNYQEQILASGADLVVMEFVNDCWLSKENLTGIYARISADFQKCGFECIIQTPHYILPSWMGTDTQKGFDDDPRPYTQFLYELEKDGYFVLADAAKLYGHLYREGIPYLVYMVNNINHPDKRGIDLYLEALSALFVR